jgi:hypothetical protein
MTWPQAQQKLRISVVQNSPSTTNGIIYLPKVQIGINSLPKVRTRVLGLDISVKIYSPMRKWTQQNHQRMRPLIKINTQNNHLTNSYPLSNKTQHLRGSCLKTKQER